MFGKLHRVGIAKHIVEENNTPHPRQLNTTRLMNRFTSIEKTLGSNRDLSLRMVIGLVRVAGIVPMPMCAEHTGTIAILHPDLQGLTGGTIQTPCHIMTRHRFK